MHTRLCGIIKTNTPEKPGCFCFSGKYGGESARVETVLGKRRSGILTRLTGDARELLPAGAPRKIRGVFAFPGSAAGNLLAGASLKCGREPKVPPTNAPLLKCGARVRWMAWLV